MKMKKRTSIKICAILALIAIFYLTLYILGISIEPYKVSLEFVDNNKAIVENLGRLKSRRLSLLGYSARYGATNGEASYKISVTGERMAGIVYIDLMKSLGQWEILRAKLTYDNGKGLLLKDKSVTPDSHN